MKNTTKRFTRKIAAMLAAVMALTATAAITASASDCENEQLIAAAKANPDLAATWEDVDRNPDNEDEIDRVYDLLERFNIWGSVCSDNDKNKYENEDGELTHDQVLEIIENAHPDGCMESPYSMNFGDNDHDDDFDDYDEDPVFTEDDWDDAEEDDEDDSEYIFNFDFGDDLMDELIENMF